MLRGMSKSQDPPQCYTALTTPNAGRLPSPTDSPDHALPAYCSSTSPGHRGPGQTLTLLADAHEMEGAEGGARLS